MHKDDKVLAILPVKPWVDDRPLQMKLYQNSQFKCGQKALVDLKISGDSQSGRSIYLQIQSKFNTYDLGIVKLGSNGEVTIETSSNETKEMFQLGKPSDQPAGAANLMSRSDCDLPMDVGNGKDESNFTIKYYYRADRKSCEPFIYQDKGGNANRFDSRTECQLKCIKKTLPEKLLAPQTQSTKAWITNSKLMNGPDDLPKLFCLLLFSIGASNSFYQLAFTIPSQLSPKFSLFAFLLDQEQGVVMDYLNGTIDEKCLANKVRASLSQSCLYFKVKPWNLEP